MIYSLWYSKTWNSYTFHPGLDRPRLVDGSPQAEDEVCVWTVEVPTWEEAVRSYHAYMGWTDEEITDPSAATS